MATFLSVLRSGARSLRHRPGFALVAILTLAFGIGANTAVFTLAETLLLRPLPYADPARLVMVWQAGPDDFGDEVGSSILDFQDWRRSLRKLSALAAYGSSGFNLSSGGGAEYVEGQVVSANYFETLGARPVLGRGFRVDEEEAGAPPVVVLSDGLWRRQYGADERIVGRSIQLSGEPHTVIGVMERGWRAPERAELWVPLSFYTGNWRQWRTTHQLTLIGRLAPGETVQGAQAEAASVARAIWAAQGLDGFREWSIRLEPLVDQLLGSYRRTVMALWIAVALLLVITCANLANLMLVRGIARARELAVRSALGASRARLMLEVMSEALLIAAAGCLVGITGAAAALRAMHALLPRALQHLVAPGISPVAVVYGLAIALGSALLFSAIPAWRVGRGDTHALLAAARTVGGGHRLGYGFVVLQISLAVPLLAASLLMVRTMRNLGGIDAGVRAESVVTFRVAPSPAAYRDPVSRPRLYRRIEERMSSMPGVEMAGMSSNIPFSTIGTQTSTSLFVEGRAPEERGSADIRAASPGLLRTLGMRVIAGRWIEGADLAGPRVAVINETLARRLWPRGNPIGARIVDGNETLPADDPNRWFTIVGIVGDARSGGLRTEPVPEVYLPYGKRPTRTMMFVVRGRDGAALMAAARQAVREADPAQAAFDVAAMQDLVAGSIAGPRLASRLLTILGVAALLLTTIGTYGVVAYSVGLRRKEFAIRASLGATPRSLGRMILRDGARVTIAGLAAGLLLARGGSTMLASLLHGVDAGDALVLTATIGTMLLCVLGATLLPARAALRVNPAEALRQE